MFQGSASCPASPSEHLSSIFSSAGLYSHCCSAVFTCHLVQATDRQQIDQIGWLQLPPPAESTLMVTSDLGSVLSHLSHKLTQTQTQNVEPLVFKPLDPNFFTLSSYSSLRLHLVSPFCSFNNSDCWTTHSTLHTLQHKIHCGSLWERKLN